MDTGPPDNLTILDPAYPPNTCVWLRRCDSVLHKRPHTAVELDDDALVRLIVFRITNDSVGTLSGLCGWPKRYSESLQVCFAHLVCCDLN